MFSRIHQLQLGHRDKISHGASRTAGKSEGIGHATSILSDDLEYMTVAVVDGCQAVCADSAGLLLLLWCLLLWSLWSIVA